MITVSDHLAHEVLIDLALYQARLMASASPLVLPVDEFDFSEVQYGDRIIDEDFIAVRGGQKFDNGRFLTVEHTRIKAEKYLNAIGYTGTTYLFGEYLRLDGSTQNPLAVARNGHRIDPFREASTAALPTFGTKPYYAGGTLELMVFNVLKHNGGLVPLSSVISDITNAIGGRKDQDKNQRIEDCLMDLWMLELADRYQGVDGIQYFQLN